MTEDNRQRLISRRPMDVPARAALARRWLAVDVQARRRTAHRASRPPVAAATAPPTPPSDRRRSVGRRDPQDFRPLVFWLGSATTGAGRTRDDDRHAAGLADDLPDHGGRRRHGVAVRIRRARDPRHEAADAAAGVPALPSQGRPRVLRRRGHQLGNDAGDAVVTIQSSRSRHAAVRRHVTRTFRLAPGASEPVRFDALARGDRQRARADDA